MTSATPAAAIEARLRANWSATVIFVENKDFEPPRNAQGQPEPFVALEFPGAGAQQWSIGDPGNNAWREDGAFMLHLCVPTGTGGEQARAWSDDLAAIFRGKEFDFVVCHEVMPPVPSESPDGLFYRLSSAVRYHYEYRG